MAVAATLLLLPGTPAHAIGTVRLNVFLEQPDFIECNPATTGVVIFEFDLSSSDTRFFPANQGIQANVTLFGADPFSDDRLISYTVIFTPDLTLIPGPKSRFGCVPRNILDEDDGLTSGDEIYARIAFTNIATGFTQIIRTNEVSGRF